MRCTSLSHGKCGWWWDDTLRRSAIYSMHNTRYRGEILLWVACGYPVLRHYSIPLNGVLPNLKSIILWLTRILPMGCSFLSVARPFLPHVIVHPSKLIVHDSHEELTWIFFCSWLAISLQLKRPQADFDSVQIRIVKYMRKQRSDSKRFKMHMRFWVTNTSEHGESFLLLNFWTQAKISSYIQLQKVFDK